MSQWVMPGDPPIPIQFRPSRRARRLSLRVSSLDGRVSVSFPVGYSKNDVLSFLNEKERWLRRTLNSQKGMIEVAIGAHLSIEGVNHEIVAGKGRSAVVANAKVAVPQTRAGVVLKAFLRNLARERVSPLVDRYAAELNKEPGRLSFRDTRSRWGSCTIEGNLMFSWRLAMAPSEVLSYVVAHEVAHLRHMHHQLDFWDEVTGLYGDYTEERRWLRTEGSELHRYRFGG